VNRILGVDWGARWIGTALSDPTQIIASPLGRYEVRSKEEALKTVMDLIGEHEVEAVVVGIPYNMNGSLGEMGKTAKTFATALEERSGKPVHPWDERLTTVQADRALKEGGMSRGNRKSRRDVIAAQIILQSFLDAQKSRRTDP
jgi:putative Holliday junction resolvase